MLVQYCVDLGATSGQTGPIGGEIGRYKKEIVALLEDGGAPFTHVHFCRIPQGRKGRKEKFALISFGFPEEASLQETSLFFTFYIDHREFLFFLQFDSVPSNMLASSGLCSVLLKVTHSSRESLHLHRHTHIHRPTDLKAFCKRSVITGVFVLS